MILRVSSVVAILCVSQVFCGAWFNYRLLRNPGLTNDTAGCHAECVSKCVSTPGCSGVSYRSSSKICLKSMCNSLDLVKNTGWNTYVIGSLYFEVAGAQPLFEWALTDTCGNNNLGVLDGPAIYTSNAQYISAPSASAGQVMKFWGTSSTAATGISPKLNFALGSGSLTVMFWVLWDQLLDGNIRNPFLEFWVGNLRYTHFWLHNGGLWYSFISTTCASNCALNPYLFTPTINVWYHVAFVYDGQYGTMKTFLNYSLVDVHSVGNVANNVQWDNVKLASTPVDTNSALIGRIFCIKLFNVSLINSQVASIGQSCLSGKVRFPS